MEDLKEYDTIATKIIATHAPSFKLDTEIIEAVTSAIMMADWQYDPTDYTGQGKKTLNGYRKQRAVWAIRETLKRKKRKARNSPEQIDNLDDNAYIETLTYQSDLNFNLDFLTEKESEILDLRFNKSFKLREIGRRLKCTKQNVHHQLKSGLRKLRKNQEILSTL